jgi:hypothetical protein
LCQVIQYICFVGGWPIGLSAHCQGILQQIHCSRYVHVDFRQQSPAPGAVLNLIRTHGKVLYTAFQPLLRVRLALNKAVQPQNQVLQRHILAIVPEALHQSQECLRSLFIFFLKQIFDHFQLDQTAFCFVPDPETGVQIDDMEVFTDYADAKRMQCADGGLGQKVHLSPEVLAAAITVGLPVAGLVVVQRLCQGGADPLTHLAGCGIGKGHNQQAVNVHAVLQDQLQNTFHQNRSLARTGSCCYQQIAVSGINCRLLFRRPLCHR